MSRSRPPRRVLILEEETVRLDGFDASSAENPYWLEDDQPEPPPDPTQGCTRRNRCCKNSPGWFAPGEAEEAAAALGMTPDAFVRRYLVIDSITLEGERVEVFAPLKLGRDGAPLLPPGSRADALYQAFRGPCIFFREAGCQIYAARPIECRRYLCTQPEALNISHAEIARLWRPGAAEDPTP